MTSSSTAAAMMSWPVGVLSIFACLSTLSAIPIEVGASVQPTASPACAHAHVQGMCRVPAGRVHASRSSARRKGGWVAAKHALCCAARLPLEPEKEAREQPAEHQRRQGASDGDGDTAQSDELEHGEVDVEAGLEHEQHQAHLSEEHQRLGHRHQVGERRTKHDAHQDLAYERGQAELGGRLARAPDAGEREGEQDDQVEIVVQLPPLAVARDKLVHHCVGRAADV